MVCALLITSLMIKVAWSLVTLLPACAASADRPTASDYDEIAASVGSSTSHHGGDTSALSDVAMLATGRPLPGFTLGGDGSFHGDAFGLTYAFSIACSDLQRRALPACDPDTNVADVDLAWSGAIDLPLLEDSEQRTGHWTLGGLTQATAAISGVGHLEFDSATPTSAFHFAYDVTYQLSYDAAALRPIGGSLDYAIDASITRGGELHAVAIDGRAEFSPDGGATLVLDGTQRYHVDADTGSVARL